MDDTTWDPERLRIVGSVLSRYSAYLAPGHRIRLGMEGDPCSTFRSADDAPRATVVDVTHGDHGEIHFRAQLDGSDTIIERDNRNVAPDRLWEIDPEYVEEFRDHVHRAQRSSAASRASSPTSVHENEEEPPTYAGTRDEIEYRSSVETHFQRVERQMEDMESANRAFRETMASTVRALAGDLLRAAQGAPIEFAHQYADRYDLAVAERVSAGMSDYRGDGKNKDRYQGEKTDYSLERRNIEADSTLTE